MRRIRMLYATGYVMGKISKDKPHTYSLMMCGEETNREEKRNESTWMKASLRTYVLQIFDTCVHGD